MAWLKSHAKGQIIGLLQTVSKISWLCYLGAHIRHFPSGESSSCLKNAMNILDRVSYLKFCLFLIHHVLMFRLYSVLLGDIILHRYCL